MLREEFVRIAKEKCGLTEEEAITNLGIMFIADAVECETEEEMLNDLTEVDVIKYFGLAE